jgi:hypothetical protein
VAADMVGKVRTISGRARAPISSAAGWSRRRYRYAQLPMRAQVLVGATRRRLPGVA